MVVQSIVYFKAEEVKSVALVITLQDKSLYFYISAKHFLFLKQFYLIDVSKKCVACQKGAPLCE